MQARQFHLDYSKIYNSIVLFLCLASTLGILLAQLAWYIKMLALIVLFLYTGWIIWQDGLLHSKYVITRLAWVLGEPWQLISAAGVQQGVLRKDSMVTKWLMVLRFDVVQARPISCLIFYDALSPIDYQYLLVIMRISAHH